MAITLLPTIKSAVDDATRRLAGTVTGSPRLDAEVLMAYELRWLRSRVFAHWDEELSADAIHHYMHLVERRAAGEPVAYIRNLKEFLGLDFYVDSRVLIPRPETELLVARAVAWLGLSRLRPADSGLRTRPRTPGPGPRTVVDVGTGSGAVAIGITKSVPSARLIATDSSLDALAVAQINADRHDVRQIEFVHGSLLEPVAGPVDLVVANLPYLSRAEYGGLLDTSIAYEPRAALTDEADGLQLFADLFAQVPTKLAPDGCLLLEIGSGQPAGLRQLARDRLPDFQSTVFADYAGLPRVLQLVPSPAEFAVRVGPGEV